MREGSNAVIDVAIADGGCSISQVWEVVECLTEAKNGNEMLQSKIRDMQTR